jgi:hypothetical protein
MKTPASILATGIISLGFVVAFPMPNFQKADMPSDGDTKNEAENNNDDNIDEQKVLQLQQRCKSLARLHILVSLISFCSELLAVMWATVAVNQLTETVVAPAHSVWDLLQRDHDLAWSATNSHFVLGMLGFMWMVGIRGYVMLLAEEAGTTLIMAAMSGVASAFLLMVSIVNRGVESGGGEGIGYGATILALFQHYVVLLCQCSISPESWGPLELGSIVLECVSLVLALRVILTGQDEKQPERIVVVPPPFPQPQQQQQQEKDTGVMMVVVNETAANNTTGINSSPSSPPANA